MASDQRSRIFEMVNPTQPVPSPTPEQAPSPPPQAPVPPPPEPQTWAVPAAPASAGGQGIVYTESAMERFAATSDDRARSLQQIHARAQQTQVAPDAFGFMFGRLVYSAYAHHAQSVSDGLVSATNAMTAIADGVRDSAASIKDVNAAAAHAAAQATTPAEG